MNNLTATTASQLSTLAEKISAASDRLKPASEDMIAATLIRLEGTGMTYAPSVKNARKAYAFALKNIPAEAFRAVTQKLVQGEYQRFKVDQIPIPAELAGLCREEARKLIDDAARLREAYDTMASTSRRSIPEDERERVRARIAHIRTQRQIDKATQGLDPGRPMDDEEAARFKAILGLPDRKEITPENLAYRAAVVDRMPE